ncbi:MAG TPA: hypothetical protein VJ810_17760 [Blastocatellia bacterium]|nr:hypothetical protein [Blastocatellia bacterium]
MPRVENEHEELSRTVIRIQAGVLAVVCALIGGIGLFGMTVWLLIKGGESVGMHLQLLGNYFIGYTVTWTGSLIGFLYGALFGGLVGWTIGKIYNVVAGFRQK